jgi:hypothetical protein
MMRQVRADAKTGRQAVAFDPRGATLDEHRADAGNVRWNRAQIAPHEVSRRFAFAQILLNAGQIGYAAHEPINRE